MSEAHKKALADGRSQAQDVRRYLEALERNRPRPGRKRTEDSVLKRLQALDAQIDKTVGTQRLMLIQERLNLRQELDKMRSVDDLAALQQRFIEVARDYAQRRGVTYAAWREFGVPTDVLRQAGLTPSS